MEHMPMQIKVTIATQLCLMRDAAKSGLTHAYDSDDRDYYKNQYDRAVEAIKFIDSLIY